MACGIGAGDLQCIGRNFSGVNFGARQFLGQGQGDAAGTCADINDAEQGGGQGARPT